MTLQRWGVDLLIIGAGPAGIATAVEARRAGIERIQILEKGHTHSFSIEKLYMPGKRVDKAYLGQEVECEGASCIIDGTRESVLRTMGALIAMYELPIQYDAEVRSIHQADDGTFLVKDSTEWTHRSKTVVIAIGVYGRPNKPNYAIPASLRSQVHFDLTQGLGEGSRVLVVGGGNTALEYAAFLYAHHRVTLSYRGSVFARANEINRRILEELQADRQVDVWTSSDLEALRDAGDAPRVEVQFKDGRMVRFDHVVYALGGSTPQGFLQQAGIALEGNRALVDHRYHTRVPGLFLAGDLVTGGKGSIVKAFNTGHRVVWEGLCRDHLECRIPEEKVGPSIPQ